MKYEPWNDPGHFRIVDVIVGVHEPPPWAEVPAWMDQLCMHLAQNTTRGSLYLAAYTMWFLCWVHPFCEGNGRIARAAAYLVLSSNEGVVLPGTLTIHQQIQDDEKTLFEYLDGIHEADRAWKHEERIELRGLIAMIERLLLRQLQS